jgi:PPM family protein phosphatase
MKLICAGMTDVGCAREHNEDDFYLSQGDEALCIVADGMGGHSSGEVASAMAIRAIVDYYRETIPEDDVNGYDDSGESDLDRVRLTEALKVANRVVFEAASDNEDLDGMGTTIVSGYFTEEGVYMAHIGDSRAYRYRDGELEQMTPDHSLANEYVRMGILAKEDVEFFPYKNVITRACGLAEQVEVEVQYEEVQPNDLFIFCSDGLSDMVPDKQILEILEDEDDLEQLCRKLVERANQNGGDDNITVIVAQVVESES